MGMPSPYQKRVLETLQDIREILLEIRNDIRIAKEPLKFTLGEPDGSQEASSHVQRAGAESAEAGGAILGPRERGVIEELLSAEDEGWTRIEPMNENDL